MSQIPPPPEHDQTRASLIDQGAHLAAWLIGEIAVFLTPQAGKFFDRRYLRWLARHYLLPAEAVLRRAIHLLAETLPPPAPVQPKQPAHPRAGVSPDRQHPNKPRTPQFRLTEPPPRPSTNYIPVSQRPRISVPSLTPRRPAPTPQEQAAPLEARLRRRLAALEAALANPHTAALRLHRLRARGHLKSPTLSFTKIPGAGAETINDVAAQILRALNNAAFEVAAAICLEEVKDTS